MSFNAKPAPIDEEVIELLQARVGSEGFLRVGEAVAAWRQCTDQRWTMESFGRCCGAKPSVGGARATSADRDQLSRAFND